MAYTATNQKRLLELALNGLTLERQRIEEEMRAISKQLGKTTTAAPKTSASPDKSRGISETHRKKIAAAMKAHWVQRRKRQQKTTK